MNWAVFWSVFAATLPVELGILWRLGWHPALILATTPGDDQHKGASVGERFKSWLAVGLCGFVAVAALIDQLSGGKFPVPVFLADLAKVAVPALFVADGLQSLAANRRNRNEPPTTPPPAEGDEP